MPLNQLSTTTNKVVGQKQTLRALKDGAVHTVFLAQDADGKVTKPVLSECEGQSIEVVTVESMEALGKACSIKVKAAVAAILKS